MGPALRANPFPEVTDLFCRLPLSTLFYQLEATHLGDLMRLWVRTEDHHSHGVSRAVESAPNTSKVPVLYEPCTPISGRTDSRGTGLLTRKDNSPRGSLRRSRDRSRCRLWSLRPRNINLVPFRAPSESLFPGFPLALRTGSLTSNCCSRQTLLHFSLQSSHLNICYYHQDLH